MKNETQVHPAALETQEQESVLSNIDFDFKVEEGKLVFTVGHEGSDAGIELKLNVDSDRLLDKLEAAIPGDWDKTIIAVLKGVIKNVKVK